jgi:hypothetical protein
MFRALPPFSLATLALLAVATLARADNATTKPVAMKTEFAKKVDPSKPLPEYPRPQLVRADWQSLNGSWQYAVTDAAATKPVYNGQIVVPFPIQSQLSGVAKPFDPAQRLWYHRTVVVPAAWKGQRILLHFGAVSWQAIVMINGVQAAVHRGDYDAFTVDVTDAAKTGSFDLTVQVADPIDTPAGGQPRGKQVATAHTIYYTASTGIWRTVWIEPVGQAYIDHLVMKPDIDNGALLLTVVGANADPFDRLEVIASSQGKEVGRVEGQVGQEMTLPIPTPHLWSFDDPFLYDLKVTLYHGTGASDEATSYFGMRKVSVAKDAAGILRPMINNKFVYQVGVLDQGFWPAGLYTAPTDEALKYDILMTKKFGFNVSRKHVKVEPDRWYYWCDKLGLMVWQDMPSIDLGGDTRLTDAQAAQFRTELTAMVDGLYNHPSIIQWDIFNEQWGQHDTKPLTDWLTSYDPTRLVDSASGFHDYHCGQVDDQHSYPGPGSPTPDDHRIAVLGEFGGITTEYPGHTWDGTASTFGYGKTGDPSLLATKYPSLMLSVWPLISKPGLSASIYTQLTDVMQEENGLMTFDRIPKVDPLVIRGANRVPGGTPGEFFQGDAPEINLPGMPVATDETTPASPTGAPAPVSGAGGK